MWVVGTLCRRQNNKMGGGRVPMSTATIAAQTLTLEKNGHPLWCLALLGEVRVNHGQVYILNNMPTFPWRESSSPGSRSSSVFPSCWKSQLLEVRCRPSPFHCVNSLWVHIGGACPEPDGNQSSGSQTSSCTNVIAVWSLPNAQNWGGGQRTQKLCF